MKHLITVILGLLFSISVYAIENEQKVLGVMGTGSVASTPDMLRFSIYIEEKGEVASKLNGQLNFKTQQVVELLLDYDVAEKDIQSMRVDLYPWFERDRNTQIQKGFVLSRSIKVTLRDLEKYAAILDGVLKIGTQRIDGFQYEIENNENAYLSALDLAIKDAQKRANKMAGSLGVKVGEILSIQEHSQYSPQPERMRASMSMADSGGMMPGQLTISAQVALKFRIQE